MVWRGLGRLSALVVFGFASAPVSAEPLIQIAQAEQSEGGASTESASPAIEPEAPPAGTPEPARETGSDSQAETPAPAASPPPKQSDAELETITVKPSRQTPRTTTVARKPAPGASAGEPGGAQAASAATHGAPAEPAGIGLRSRRWFRRHAQRDGHQDRHADCGDSPVDFGHHRRPHGAAPRHHAERGIELHRRRQTEPLWQRSRYDWVSIRGFDAYFPGFYFDGLFARNNNTWAVWRVEPYGAERIEVLKGPSSVLYGQTNPGGLINVVTKRPTEEPIREVEMLFGNRDQLQPAFDIGDKVTEDGKVRYRITGLGLSADTDVDFADRNEFFIAPGVTWRPSADTSLTILGAIYPLQFGHRHHVSAGGRIAPAQSERQRTPEHQSRRTQLRWFRSDAMDGQLFSRPSHK